MPDAPVLRTMLSVALLAVAPSLVAGCGAINDIRRNLQTLETNKVPVEGTDEANRMHDLLAARVDSVQAETTLTALLTTSAGPIEAVVGQPGDRSPTTGLTSSHCDPPYGGLTGVQQLRVETTWEAAGPLTDEAREKIREAVRAAGRPYAMTHESSTPTQTSLDEGAIHPVEQFSMWLIFWENDRFDPARTNVHLTVESGCARN